MSDYYSGIRNSFYIVFSILFTSQFSSLNAQIETELIEHNDACTIVTVGKKASVDGSVMNSQTLDGHRYRTWIDIQPANNHKKGSLKKMMMTKLCRSTNIYRQEKFRKPKRPMGISIPACGA